MKSSLFRDVSVTVIIALIGFFIISSVPDMANNITFAIGAVITGIVVSVLNSNSSESVEDSDDNETTTLYIGNLAYKVNESAIKKHFSKLGYVKSVRLMQDKRTGRKKGFGFVEVANDVADKMINEFNDTTFYDRTLKVRLAKERKAQE
ncbi:RNA-binding protein [Paraneptunicella aestuarii]|uniref:RNA recognition motif domain-containing protein n=1 Tax=Paraneptunicella aestuarii TaxID=2831148 RepID=UPI001E3BCF8B|nr:RNA-binding protein [Paraneptunicella aestuarii]UAA39361.1 RNA-binding protein [Paraneptunicella aestuarii]